jgi:hypothetical protein
VIEDNRALLRAKYEEAKELGARAGAAKAAISAAKAQLEQLRAQRAVAGEGGGAEGCMCVGWECWLEVIAIGCSTCACRCSMEQVMNHLGIRFMCCFAAAAAADAAGGV